MLLCAGSGERMIAPLRLAVGLGWALALMMGAGCDGDAAACESPNTGAASGDLSGWTDEVVRASYHVGYDLETTAYIVGLDTEPGACGEASDTGDHLLLIWLDAPPVEGAHEIGAAGAPFALFENDGPADENVADSGTVVIDAMLDDCVAGSFDLEFPGETLTGHLAGSFAAVICE